MVRNEQAGIVEGPIQGLQVARALQGDFSCRVVTQGENGERPCRTTKEGYLTAIRRKVRLPTVVVRVQAEASDFGAPPIKSIEDRENHFLAVVCWLGNQAQIGTSASPHKCAIELGDKNPHGRTSAYSNPHYWRLYQ